MTEAEMKKQLPSADLAEAREILSPVLTFTAIEPETMVTIVAAALHVRSRANGFKLRAADALADEVAGLIRRRELDARSPAGDALLDYREPPQTERADRLAAMDQDLGRLRAENRTLQERLAAKGESR